MKTRKAYAKDLAYIHHVGFGDFARDSAPGLLGLLRAARGDGKRGRQGRHGRRGRLDRRRTAAPCDLSAIALAAAEALAKQGTRILARESHELARMRSGGSGIRIFNHETHETHENGWGRIGVRRRFLAACLHPAVAYNHDL